MSQSENNPFPYSDSNKRYYTYDYFLKKRYGGKCVKIPLDAGFTCPNIDGKCGFGGCIYCSGRGSGDCAAQKELSIEDQYDIIRRKMSSKWSTEKCIPYFQAHTNTYAPVESLKDKFERAIRLDGAVALNIATRADCLPPDVVEYLADLSFRTDLTVELGLQTSLDKTAEFINRGHSFSDFKDGFKRLTQASNKIMTCIHLIFGLPNESKEDMLQSVKDVAQLHPTAVKLHLLHVIKGTELERLYQRGEYTPMKREDYIDTVCSALEILPSDIVIGRLTGDGLSDSLIAPEWSRKKVTVINDIDKKLYMTNSYQGKKYLTHN